MLQLDLKENCNIPRLAWCAQIDRNKEIVVVHHGSWVERNEHCFFEGAWSGDCSDYDFANAATFTGTGGCLIPSGLLLAAPTNTLQPVFLINTENRLICSNSVSFLLVACDDDVDINYRNYEFDMMSIMSGLQNYKRDIPTRNGNSILIRYYCNILISADLKIEELEKRKSPPFESFEDYRSVLCSEISLVADNAADPARRIRYNPLTLISSGYDSPAVSVLAREVGCDEAITFTNARASFEDQNDSGKDIATILGLQCSEHDANAYRDMNNFPEADFVAAGTGGDDVYLACLEHILPKRLLFTGDGARVWEVNNREVGPNVIRRDPSGCSSTEFRLRVGYINFPVPYIGCREHHSIYAVSFSPEMRPWWMENTKYNKPIPRRIVEMAGVPREFFGQKKKAVARPYHMTTGRINPPLEQVFSRKSREDFSKFVQGVPLYKHFFEMLSFLTLHRMYHINRRLITSRKLQSFCRMLGLSVPDKPYLPWLFAKKRTIHCFIYHWGIHKIKSRYANFDQVTESRG